MITVSVHVLISTAIEDFDMVLTFHARIQRGGGQGVRTPMKNHKNLGFLSNTGPDLLKITKLPSASIQCWASKMPFNGVLLAGQ